MPHKVDKGWRWGNIERPTKKELAQTVYWIWQKNGAKGSFNDFWETGKVTGDAKDGRAIKDDRL
jgi:hypothetical protein